MDEQNINKIDEVTGEVFEGNPETEKEQTPEINTAPEMFVTSESDQSAPQEQDMFTYDPYSSYVPVVELSPVDTPDPERKSGIKVFAIIMAAVILFCGSLTVGYHFGKDNSKLSGRPTVNVDLSAKPADTDMLTAAEVYEKANMSVVGITIYNDSYVANASGVVFSEDGYIITNDHIYSEIASAKFKVHTSDGKIYSAEYVAGDTRSDIAVIKITDKVKLVPAEFGNPDELYVGEPLVAMGRPTGAATDNNLTGGYVSALGRRSSATSNYTMRFIQSDTAINPGSSGGAFLNMYGQVVGIISYKISATKYEGMGFAVPMDIAKSVAESLIKYGYVDGRAKIGISYTEIDAVTAEVYKMNVGLYVSSIDADSSVYGKISKGDIIVEVNGEKITSADDMLDVIENSLPGDSLVLVVISGGETKTVSAKLIADKGSSSYTITQNNYINPDENGVPENPFGE